MLVNQVAAGIKSQKHAIKDLNNEYKDEDAEKEILDILTEKGMPVLQDDMQGSVDNMENIAPKNDNLENSNS